LVVHCALVHLTIGDFSKPDEAEIEFLPLDVGSMVVMSRKHEKSAVSRRADGCLRPLQNDEVQELERALGKPIDRAYLVFWVSRAIGDCVRLSMQPTPREAQ
jgi:hypothetical protein